MSKRYRSFQPLTSKQKRKMCKHITWEMHMLRVCCDLWTNGGVRPVKLSERQHALAGNEAVAEALLLHTRLMIEFLYKDDKQLASDVLALDYCSSPATWRKRIQLNGKRGKSLTLSTVYRITNKRIAHITTDRLESVKLRGKAYPEGDPRVNLACSIVPIIETAWKDFVRSIGKPYQKAMNGWMQRWTKGALN